MAIEKKSLTRTLKTAKQPHLIAGSKLSPKASNITSKKPVAVAKYATKIELDSFSFGAAKR